MIAEEDAYFGPRCDECGSPGRCRPDCSFVRGVSKDEPEWPAEFESRDGND